MHLGDFMGSTKPRLDRNILDVKIESPEDGETLVYSSSLEKFINATISGSLPEGVNDGDMLQWSASLNTWVVVSGGSVTANITPVIQRSWFKI